MSVYYTQWSLVLNLAISLSAIALYALYRCLLPTPIRGIPYNPDAAKRLLGDAPDMLREVSATGEFGVWCAKQVEKMNSPVCQVFIRPFAKPWVLVADFRESRDILMRRREFDKSKFISDGMACLGDFHGLFQTGDAFKSNRQLVQDLMTSSFLNNFAGPAIHDMGLELVELLGMKMKLANGRPFSVSADIEYTAVDSMLRFAFGENWTETTLGPQIDLLRHIEPSDIGDGDLDKAVDFPKFELDGFLWSIYETPKIMERATVSWFPKLSFWWWSKQSWYKKVFAQKNQVLKEQVRKAIDNYRSGRVKSAVEHMLMREAARAEKHGQEPDFHSHIITDEIFGDIVAGHHTTSGAMLWLIKYLVDYPDVQIKLRTILRGKFPSAVEETRSPSFQELRSAKIPYLEACIEEMNRLNAFTVTRHALRDTQILGYPIPRGTEVFMVSNGPGYLAPSLPVDSSKRTETSRTAKLRDKWDDTQDLTIFQPDRWLVDSGDGNVDFDGAAGPQLVFGLGPRACWGRRLAHLELRTVIALLIWNYELLKVPQALNSYGAHEGIARVPHVCYIRLKEAQIEKND